MSDKLQTAILRLYTKYPFAASVFASMKCHTDDSIETMATDCVNNVFVGPAFVEGITMKETCGVLAHEAYHKALLHTFRYDKSMNFMAWNIAGDFIINRLLINEGHELPGRPMPLSELLANVEAQLTGSWSKPENPEPRYMCGETDGMNEEEVYAKIMEVIDEHSQGGSGGSGGSGGDGSGMSTGEMGDIFSEDMQDADDQFDPSGKTAPTREDARRQAEIDVQRAADQAKAAGKLPAFAELLVKELEESGISWEKVLQNFCTRTLVKDDFGYSRAHRDYLAQGIIAPSLEGNRPGTVVIAVDTSGSCRSALARFGGECSRILSRVRPQEVIVLYVDREIARVDRFHNGQRFEFVACGGGGTSFVPPFEWCKENNVRPDAFIYLTDAYGDFPDRANFPVLWALTETHGETPGWGQEIVLKGCNGW